MRTTHRIGTAVIALAIGLGGGACTEDDTGAGEEATGPVEDIVENTADEADEVQPEETQPGFGTGDDVGDESPGEG